MVADATWQLSMVLSVLVLQAYFLIQSLFLQAPGVSNFQGFKNLELETEELKIPYRLTA